MNSFYGYHWVNGYRVDFFGWDDKKDQLIYEINGKIRKAKRQRPPAMLRLHGNPYPGTIIEYYTIILPTGKKVKYNIYA